MFVCTSAVVCRFLSSPWSTNIFAGCYFTFDVKVLESRTAPVTSTEGYVPKYLAVVNVMDVEALWMDRKEHLGQSHCNAEDGTFLE